MLRRIDSLDIDVSHGRQSFVNSFSNAFTRAREPEYRRLCRPRWRRSRRHFSRSALFSPADDEEYAIYRRHMSRFTGAECRLHDVPAREFFLSPVSVILSSIPTFSA